MSVVEQLTIFVIGWDFVVSVITTAPEGRRVGWTSSLRYIVIHIVVFWYMTAYRLGNNSHYYEEALCLHRQCSQEV